MKTIILILWFMNGDIIHISVKGKSCDNIFKKTVIWQDNKNYKQGSFEPWGYYTYKNKPILAHTCMEKNKKTYFIGE